MHWWGQLFDFFGVHPLGRAVRSALIGDGFFWSALVGMAFWSESEGMAFWSLR